MKIYTLYTNIKQTGKKKKKTSPICPEIFFTKTSLHESTKHFRNREKRKKKKKKGKRQKKKEVQRIKRRGGEN